MEKEKDKKGTYVVSYRLYTNKQDEDKLSKILNILTLHYNNVQRKMVNKYKYMSQSKIFQKRWEESWNKLSADEKREYNDLLKRNNISKYGLDHYFRQQKAYSLQGIGSHMLVMLSRRCWSAWEKKLKDLKVFINTKNSINSISTDRLTEIAIDYSNHSVKIPRMGIKCLYNFRGTDYESFSEQDEIRVVTISRNMVRGKYMYFLKITYAGTPYNKGRKLGQGKVGIDTSMRKMYVVYENGDKATLELAPKYDGAKYAILQRKLDRQRRSNNPDAYDEKGCCCVTKGEKYQWVYSKGYLKTLTKLQEMSRKTAWNRKIRHFKLANYLIANGNSFNVEPLDYKALSHRSKKTTINSKGRYNSKKRYGKSISNGAPSSFLTILHNKIDSISGMDYNEVSTYNACTQFDHTNSSFKTKEEVNIKYRTLTLSDGFKIHRDYHAAMNIMFCNPSLNPKKKKGNEKSEANFDIPNMKIWYDKYKENLVEETCISI